MKKTLLISGLLLALTAPVASAGGINLNWGNCATGSAPLPLDNVNFLCNTNTGLAFQLFASFVPNVGQNVAAFEYVIDLQSSGAGLPAWWLFKNSGSCRQTAMAMATNWPSGPADCLDPWGGTIGLQDFSYLVGHSGANTARISGGGAVPATDPVPIEAATEYYGFSLAINRTKTIGTGNCAGCLDPVCLVFNNLKLFNQVGAELDLNNPDQRNYATWQGGNIGGSGCPLATPTNKATWGRIKSIYR